MIIHSFICPFPRDLTYCFCRLYRRGHLIQHTAYLVRNSLPIELQALSNQVMHSEIYALNPSSLFPLSTLTTRWRLDRHFTFLDILPISAKRRAPTLLEAFHHCPFGVFISIGEQILEELIQRAIAAHVGVVCTRFRLLRVENGLGHAVPIFTGLWKGCTGLCRRCGGRSGRIGESWSVT